MLWGRDLMMKGYRWLVGNGRSIARCAYFRFQKIEERKLCSFMGGDNVKMVSDLKEPSDEWRYYVIKGKFDVAEGNAVLAIPYSTRNCEDKLILRI